MLSEQEGLTTAFYTFQRGAFSIPPMVFIPLPRMLAGVESVKDRIWS